MKYLEDMAGHFGDLSPHLYGEPDISNKLETILDDYFSEEWSDAIRVII